MTWNEATRLPWLISGMSRLEDGAHVVHPRIFFSPRVLLRSDLGASGGMHCSRKKGKVRLPPLGVIFRIRLPTGADQLSTKSSLRANRASKADLGVFGLTLRRLNGLIWGSDNRDLLPKHSR